MKVGCRCRDSAGNFYGSTSTGGKHGYGTIVKISPAGKISVLASLDPSKMANPLGGAVGGLVRDSSGNLYGVAARGPNLSSNAVIFKLAPDGVLSPVASFLAGPSTLSCGLRRPCQMLHLGRAYRDVLFLAQEDH